MNFMWLGKFRKFKSWRNNIKIIVLIKEKENRIGKKIKCKIFLVNFGKFKVIWNGKIVIWIF